MADGASLLGAMVWAYQGKGRWRNAREANLFDGGPPFYGTYACADGRYLAVGAIEAEFWEVFTQRCGIDDPVLLAGRDDRSQWPALRERLAAILRTQTRDHWCALMADSDGCVTPVLDMQEALQHPHAVARGAFIDCAGVRQPAPAPRFGRTPGEVRSEPPLVGEHSREVLGRYGFNVDEIEQLLEGGSCALLTGPL